MAMDFLLDTCDGVEFSWDNANSLPSIASADWMGREIKVQKDSSSERTFGNLRPLSLLAFTNSKLAGRVNLNSKLSKEDGLEAVLCRRNHDSQKSVNASGTTGLKLKWGGKEGVECSGYIEGQVSDRKGNSFQANATQNSDGTGDVDFKGLFLMSVKMLLSFFRS